MQCLCTKSTIRSSSSEPSKQHITNGRIHHRGTTLILADTRDKKWSVYTSHSSGDGEEQTRTRTGKGFLFSHVLLYIRPREQCRRNALKAVIRTRSSRTALPVPALAPAPPPALSLSWLLLPPPLVLLVRALRLFLASFSSFLASASATLATSQKLATYLEQNHLQGRAGMPPGGALNAGAFRCRAEQHHIQPGTSRTSIASVR